MAKIKTRFICQECGADHPKWEGRCKDCGEWNSLVEEVDSKNTRNQRGWALGSDSATLKTIPLNNEVHATPYARIHTGLNELDRVLGSGLVMGSYVLLGGDPGIGKSTLLMQMAGGLGENKKNVLYISGEESVSQTALRAQRLGIRNAQVEVGSESQLEKVLKLAQEKKPQVLIIDSIQTIYLSEISSAPGSVSQVRECAARLMGLAKTMDMSVFIIGHVTKDGHIAGPKVLEHMVDTVLSFEGDHHHQYRLLRAIKNRFGPTNELGVFQMAPSGLIEVSNPSELFLEERSSDVMGSAIFPAMEGSRPLLCEVQALTIATPMAMPRRNSNGYDLNRVHLLIAVLDKFLSTELMKNDVYVNIVGGLKLTEPCADLAVAAAIVSSIFKKDIDPKTCFFGELGLTGEVRPASFAIERVKEAQKLGFDKFVLSHSNKKHIQEIEKDLKGRFFFLKHVKELQSTLL